VEQAIMKHTDFKNILRFSILESNFLSKKEKRQLIIFVEKTDIYSILNFLEREKIQDIKKITKKQILENFKSKFHMTEFVDPMTAMKVAGFAVLTATQIYKTFFNSASKMCESKSGVEKVKCIRNVKINALNRKISIIRSKMSECAKTNNPQKCREKLQKHIDKVNEKIKKLRYGY